GRDPEPGQLLARTTIEPRRPAHRQLVALARVGLPLELEERGRGDGVGGVLERRHGTSRRLSTTRAQPPKNHHSAAAELAGSGSGSESASTASAGSLGP